MSSLTKEQHDILLTWVKRYFSPIKGINRDDASAYRLHGIFERLYPKGFYVTEFDVADAMIECGYHSKEIDGQIYFNISQKSRALQIFEHTHGDPRLVDPAEWL